MRVMLLAFAATAVIAAAAPFALSETSWGSSAERQAAPSVRLD